ncbi:unnamed protein product [Candidula unifasciata]|uniref:Glycosyl transferase family 1 domain-containing protein n=1 Tax=Candidula unifasciata TaxID=100452 RepID=A0A8S4A4T9_9EUPU|nr:unnamed protein product [Candidula unifasciata]
MSPTLYLLSPGSQKGGGNYCTISRISEHLRNEGYRCHQDDPKELFARPDLSSIAKEEDGVMIGIHALRTGAFMKDSYLPYILILGGTDINVFCEDPVSMGLMTQAVYRARFVVCFSKVDQKRAMWLWPAIQPHKMKVIPQAVKTDPSSFCLQTYLDNHHPGLMSGYSAGFKPIIFAFIGGIRPVKNPLFLVPAFQDWHARNNRIIYLIVGPKLDATFTATVFEPAIKKRPGIVYIPGLPVEDAHAVISQSFALVNTSDSEGMCLAILEAMHLGIPVLARDCPANKAIISDSHTGHLFDSPETFLEKAEELLGNNKVLTDLTRNARDYVHAYHNLQLERQAYASLLRQCLQDIETGCHSADSIGNIYLETDL